MESTSRKIGVSNKVLKTVFENTREDIKISDFNFFNLTKKKQESEINSNSPSIGFIGIEEWLDSLSIKDRALAVSTIFYKNKLIIDSIFWLINEISQGPFYFTNSNNYDGYSEKYGDGYKNVSIKLKINIFEKKRYGNRWTNCASSD